MFGPKLTTVFRSRWNALIWSAGVLATAYCTVPDLEQASEPKAQAPVAAHHAPRNPWAKDSPAPDATGQGDHAPG